MGDAEESKVFEVSREVTNWTIPEIGDVAANDVLDYVTENYWTTYSPSGANSSFNGSLDGGNKTSVVSRDEELAKVEMAVLALIFILTVLGNCVVLLGIFFRRQKMTRMYYFILHLSVADLITAFFNVLTQLFWEITYRFQGGNLLCKFVKYLQILGPYSSSYVLVMTALDRYQAICYPLSNCTWTARRSKIMLGVAWTISLLCCVPQIFIFSYRPVELPPDVPPEYDCWATFPEVWGAKAYVTWYSITVFIIPLIILVFAYSCITRAIWINFNMKAASRNHDNYERRMTRQDSDDGDAPSHYEHSQDDSVFQRDRLSLRATASHSISANAPSKKSNINLYNPSKHFLTTIRSASTSSSAATAETMDSSGGNESTRVNKYKDSNKRGVNNIITARTSTSSSCNTQSSTLSPSLSGRRMSASEDKSGERNKNSLYFTSQKMFVSGGSGKGIESGFSELQNEEQLQLIPTDVVRSEQCHHHHTASEADVTSNACQSCEKNDLDGNNGPGSAHHLKNGSVKFSGESATDACQHGCYGKRCNHCQLSREGDDQLNMNFTGNPTRSSVTVLTKEMKTEVEAGDKLSRENSPTSSVPDRNRDQNQSHRFSGKSSSRHLLLPVTNRFSRKGRRSSGGNGSGSNQNGKQSTKSVTATYVDQQPRTHSVKGISRAKIKTIKLTVTIICCYIFCSSPFIAAQLWYVYDPNAYNSSFFKGPTFTILTLLASLNSCVNPYIFLFFNPNLLQSCFHGIFRPKYPGRRFNNGGSPLSRTLSQSKKAQLGVVGRTSMTASRYGSGTTGSGNRGQSGSRLNFPAGNEGSQKQAASSTSSSPVIRDGEKLRSQQHQILPPSSSRPEKGYLEHVSERSENSQTAVELVDSTPPPLRSSPSLQTNKQDRYPPFGSQVCRVETALDATKSHTSTLIT